MSALKSNTIKYFAVRRGRTVGIYHEYARARASTLDFKDNDLRVCKTYEEAFLHVYETEWVPCEHVEVVHPDGWVCRLDLAGDLRWQLGAMAPSSMGPMTRQNWLQVTYGGRTQQRFIWGRIERTLSALGLLPS